MVDVWCFHEVDKYAFFHFKVEQEQNFSNLIWSDNKTVPKVFVLKFKFEHLKRGILSVNIIFIYTHDYRKSAMPLSAFSPDHALEC